MLGAAAVCLLSAAAWAQVRRGPVVPTGKGSIEGTVSDGVSHEPVKKAQVMLAGGVRPLTAATDAGGRFLFASLPGGSYWVSASKTGYSPRQVLFGPENGVSIQLNGDEQKKNVGIVLMPAAGIAGRVLNEEGAPIRGCSVTAVQPQWQQNQRRLAGVSGGSTNGKGEYLLQNLSGGRYYLFAQCQMELPAPHPLLARGDPRVPHETYRPQFLGGGLEAASATRLTVQPGAVLRDMNFRMIRVPAFTLRGTIVSPVAEAPAGGASVTLFPADHAIRNLLTLSAGTDPQKSTFEIPAVTPGAYLLFAALNVNGRTYSVERAVTVGAGPPDPVTLTLAGGAELKGTVQFDCDEHAPFEDIQVMFIPAEELTFVSQSNAVMDKDGGFTVTVAPGRWRLMVGMPGYLKSVSLAGQVISPYGFQIAPGGGGAMRIVVGCKSGEISGSITGAPAGRMPSGLLYPDDAERLGGGLERIAFVGESGKIEFPGIAPGRYRLLATDLPNPWPILQRPDVLKRLESLSSLVDVPEGGRVQVAVEMVAREEIERAIDESQ